jgi:hypothetical protein
MTCLLGSPYSPLIYHQPMISTCSPWIGWVVSHLSVDCFLLSLTPLVTPSLAFQTQLKIKTLGSPLSLLFVTDLVGFYYNPSSSSGVIPLTHWALVETGASSFTCHASRNHLVPIHICENEWVNKEDYRTFSNGGAERCWMTLNSKLYVDLSSKYYVTFLERPPFWSQIYWGRTFWGSAICVWTSPPGDSEAAPRWELQPSGERSQTLVMYCCPSLGWVWSDEFTQAHLYEEFANQPPSIYFST